MANWNSAVITNVGRQLLTDTLNNQAITISSIKTTDNIYSDNIESLERLDNIKQNINVSSIEKIQNKIKISTTLTNASLTVGYNLNTIGIYARKNAQELLLAVVTASDGDYIPKNSGIGNLSINFEFFLNVNSTNNFTIQYNTNSLLTLGDLDRLAYRKEYIDTLDNKKSNKTDTVTNISFSNGELLVTKNGVQNRVTVLENATSSKRGILSEDNVKSLVNDVLKNIGLNSPNSTYNTKSTEQLNNTQNSGFYYVNKLFNGKNAVVFNYFTNSRYMQLAIEESDTPNLYIRTKYGASWSSWERLVTENKLNELLPVSTQDVAGIITEQRVIELINSNIQYATYESIWSGINE